MGAVGRFIERAGRALIQRVGSLPPDVIIDGTQTLRGVDAVTADIAVPYLRRWWVIPRNRLFNVYLHNFMRSDDDRALHTHPWLFNASIILSTGYLEWSPWDAGKPHGARRSRRRNAGSVTFRWGAAPHRVELLRAGYAVGNGKPRAVGPELPCWTLFITGPIVREWGFLCPRGFVHWREFTARNPGETGKGCGE